jgi:hypothetical protein
MDLAYAFFAVLVMAGLFGIAWYAVPKGYLTKLTLGLSSAVAGSAGLLQFLAVYDWRTVAGAEYAPWLFLVFNVAAHLAKDRKA